MTTMHASFALLLVVILSLSAVGCTAEGEISDEGANAQIEGEEGGDDG